MAESECEVLHLAALSRAVAQTQTVPGLASGLGPSTIASGHPGPPPTSHPSGAIKYCTPTTPVRPLPSILCNNPATSAHMLRYVHCNSWYPVVRKLCIPLHRVDRDTSCVGCTARRLMWKLCWALQQPFQEALPQRTYSACTSCAPSFICIDLSTAWVLQWCKELGWDVRELNWEESETERERESERSVRVDRLGRGGPYQLVMWAAVHSECCDVRMLHLCFQ